ncbi:MAG: MFS transporter [Pseudomonadales bacterium]|nr:MFS transporter [Pseudomonadales bacterium]
MQSSPIGSTANASVWTKIFYGSGATPFGIKDTGFNFFLLLYYNQVLGLDPFLTGLALALAVAIDAVSDLAVGYLSDNWRSKLGRRHPFMYLAIIPAAATFYLLWNPPSSVLEEQNTLFVYLIFMAVLVRSCLTFYEVPNAAQGPELTKDYDDRTRLMAFRYFFGWMGGLIMAVLTYVVLFQLDPAGQMGPIGYQSLGVIGGIAMMIFMLISSLGTHHHIETFYRPIKRESHSIRVIYQRFRGLFQNRSFVSVFISSLFFGAAAGLSQSLNIYINTFFWSLTLTELALIPLLGLAAVPTSFVLAPRLSEKLGKKKATMYSFLFAISFLPIAYLVQIAGYFPDRGNSIYVPLLMLNYFIETTAIITMQIIFASMNADIVEDRSAASAGERDEGLIFAARNFSKKAVSGLGVMLSGTILWIVSFPDGAIPGQVDTEVVTFLILVYLPFVMVLYLCSWYVLRYYQIDKKTHEANLAVESKNQSTT